MNNLVKVDNGQVVASSRCVSDIFERRHDNVVQAINSILNNAKTLENSDSLKVSNLFYESEYTTENANGVHYKEYLMNRDGFTLLAMGFTGSKALQWKLKYIEAFNKMEQSIQENMNLGNLSPQLQLLINIEMKQREVDEKQKQLEIANNENKKEIENMRDVIRLDTTSWRTDTAQLISKMAMTIGGFEHIKDTRQKSYELLDQRMGVSLSTRLTNKRRRMADEGVSRSRREKLNYLDIIAEDKKLIEGYVAIVKEMAIRYKVA